MRGRTLRRLLLPGTEAPPTEYLLLLLLLLLHQHHQRELRKQRERHAGMMRQSRRALDVLAGLGVLADQLLQLPDVPEALEGVVPEAASHCRRPVPAEVLLQHRELLMGMMTAAVSQSVLHKTPKPYKP